MKRKIFRNKQKNAEKILAQKVSMFSLLPEECQECQKKFNKKNKEMVNSWQVIVNNAQKKVILYCPDCMVKNDYP